ncbi:hypothetical protein BGZ72_008913 [Mortierella alpina]|nr:hypothetical protein BGZ72_008913 [Mortierella alpina]
MLLNDKDMWSHSLQAACEGELPPKETMDHLLDLFFKHIYPWCPMLIRKIFMQEYQQKRPNLQMIMLMNAMFAVACRHSDDVAVKQDAAKYFGRAKLILDETLRDDEFTVKDPSDSDEWIAGIIGEDTVEDYLEIEKVLSCQQLWMVKLARILGKVLCTMHSIDAETKPRSRAALSKTQLPQLHNSLTSWFMDLPKEFVYEAYAAPALNRDQPLSHPTASMHLMYYFSLITLHVPYFRSLDNDTVNDCAVATSSSICTAAANNTWHILESLLLQGELKHSNAHTSSFLVCSGTVFLRYATIETAEAQKIALAGVGGFMKFSLELMKIHPAAEIILSSTLDILADLPLPEPAAAEISGTQGNMNPFAILDQPHAAHLKTIYNTSKMATSSMDGFGPARSVQLRHPSLQFSAPLADDGAYGNAAEIHATWKTQVDSAFAVAATAFGAPDPRQDHVPAGDDLRASPDTLQLVPIEFMSVPSAVPDVASEESKIVDVDATASDSFVPFLTTNVDLTKD